MNNSNNIGIVVHGIFSVAILAFCVFISTNPRFQDLIIGAVAALMAYWAPSPTQQSKAQQ